MKNYENLVNLVLYLAIVVLLFLYADYFLEKLHIKPAIFLAILIALKQLLYSIVFKYFQCRIYENRFRKLKQHFLDSQRAMKRELINYSYLKNSMKEILDFFWGYDYTLEVIENVELFNLNILNLEDQGIKTFENITEKYKIV